MTPETPVERRLREMADERRNADPRGPDNGPNARALIAGREAIALLRYYDSDDFDLNTWVERKDALLARLAQEGT